mmetsp:Transcript_7171/g.16413  ORF Transcript_7171/g.16413 Transcript_7171/m.16413 type:complete len:295 (+) Transcript_7171:158-1042(+)
MPAKKTRPRSALFISFFFFSLFFLGFLSLARNVSLSRPATKATAKQVLWAPFLVLVEVVAGDAGRGSGAARVLRVGEGLGAAVGQGNVSQERVRLGEVVRVALGRVLGVLQVLEHLLEGLGALGAVRAGQARHLARPRAHGGHLLRGQVPEVVSGAARPEGARRHHLAGRDERAGRHHGVGLDHGAVEHGGAHAHEGVALDRARVHHRVGADRHVVPDHRRRVPSDLGHVDHGAVADARVVADGDLVHVAANLGAVPDGAPLANGHVAEDRCRRSHEGAARHRGGLALIGHGGG